MQADAFYHYLAKRTGELAQRQAKYCAAAAAEAAGSGGAPPEPDPQELEALAKEAQVRLA